jgi:hypothetical protein
MLRTSDLAALRHSWRCPSGMSKRRVQLTVAIIGALGAIIAAIIIGIATMNRSQGAPINTRGDGNRICIGDNACRWDGQKSQPDSQLEKVDPPKGPGPWPFVTQDTFGNGTDRGVVVRPCNVEVCSGKIGLRLGAARGNAQVYAVCRQRTDFTAGLGYPPVWIKIKWPNNQVLMDGLSVRESSPNDPYEGWIHAHFLRPIGHDGEIPEC